MICISPLQNFKLKEFSEKNSKWRQEKTWWHLYLMDIVETRAAIAGKSKDDPYPYSQHHVLEPSAIG